MTATLPRGSRPSRAAVVFAFALVLVGCGGGGGDEVSSPNVTAAAGGTVVSNDGKATLVVPAGAASAPMRVTLTTASPVGLPSTASVLPGTAIAIGGDGGPLAAEATLTFDVGPVFPLDASAGGRARALSTPVGPGPTGYCTDEEGKTIVFQWSGGLVPATCLVAARLFNLANASFAPIGRCQPTATQAICTIDDLTPRTVGVVFDPNPPALSIAATDLPAQPATLTTAGPRMLRIEASDNKGIVKVTFHRAVGTTANRQQFAVVTQAPYEATFPVTEADNGLLLVIAVAEDTDGNKTAIGVMTSVVIGAQPAPDTTPPVVSVVASSSSVQVGQGVELTALANDDVGVAKVEFFRGGTLLGADTSTPFTFAVPAFTAGDVGTIAFTARASDAAGNATTSAPAQVTVTSATVVHYVDAASGNDGNAGTAAAPFRTLTKAFATVGAGGTVWLQNGVYSAAAEGITGTNIFTGREVPAGVAIKAVHDGGPTVGFPLRFTGGGSVVGVDFDASSYGRIMASGGTTTVSRPRWVKLGTNQIAWGIEVSETAKVFLDPKGNGSHDYITSGLTGFASVIDQGELSVTGGVVDGTTGQAEGAFHVNGQAKLSLALVAITNTSGAWVGGSGAVNVASTAGTVDIVDSTIDLADAPAACLLQDRSVGGTPVTAQLRISISGSTLRRCGGGGLQLREGRPTVSIVNSEIKFNGFHSIATGQLGFDSTSGEYGRPNLTLTGSSVGTSTFAGIRMNSGGTLTVRNSILSGRETFMPNGDPAALELMNAAPYALTVTGTTFATGAYGIAAVLEGDASSTFDLGSLTRDGNNVINASLGLGVRVSVAAGVVVDAIGNTWHPATPGADANGRFTLANPVCGGSIPCEVTAGSTLNYIFSNAGAGAKLRLAK